MAFLAFCTGFFYISVPSCLGIEESVVSLNFAFRKTFLILPYVYQHPCLDLAALSSSKWLLNFPFPSLQLFKAPSFIGQCLFHLFASQQAYFHICFSVPSVRYIKGDRAIALSAYQCRRGSTDWNGVLGVGCAT